MLQQTARRRSSPRVQIGWTDRSKWFVMPKQERSRATMQRILDAAFELFAREGFDAASPADIAKEADLTTGSIYRRFPDKDAILYTIVEAYGRTRRPEVDKLTDPVRWLGKSPQDILEVYLEMLFSSYEIDNGMLRIIERRRLVDPLVDKMFTELHLNVINRYSILLEPFADELGVGDVRARFARIHQLIRGILVHRILPNPEIIEADLPIYSQDLRETVREVAMVYMGVWTA
jgi:AcrR family transcriptional regulator